MAGNKPFRGILVGIAMSGKKMRGRVGAHLSGKWGYRWRNDYDEDYDNGGATRCRACCRSVAFTAA